MGNWLIPNLVKCQNDKAWVSGSQVIMDIALQYPEGRNALLNLGEWNVKPSSHKCHAGGGAMHWTNVAKPFDSGAPCQHLWDEQFKNLMLVAWTPEQIQEYLILNPDAQELLSVHNATDVAP